MRSGRSLPRVLLWSFARSFGSVGVAFLVNLVLVRYVSPHDFGLLAMLSFFMSFATTTTVGGFSQALIQRQDLTRGDLNTVFTWNVVAALALYILLFVFSGSVASWYGEPALRDVLRVLGLAVPLQGLFLVHSAILQKELKTKTLALITISSQVLGGLLAIALAMQGAGVWALVCNTLVTVALTLIGMRVGLRLRLHIAFEKSAWRKLFSFGFSMYISQLFIDIYRSLQTVYVGKVFAAQPAGYYMQAQKLYEVPVYAVDAGVSQVTYPLLSSEQQHAERVGYYVRLQVRLIHWLLWPVVGLSVLVGRAAVELLYGSTWLPSVPVFQALCLGGVFMLLMLVYLNALKALGAGWPHFWTILLSVAITALLLFVIPRGGVARVAAVFSGGWAVGALLAAMFLQVRMPVIGREGVRDFLLALSVSAMVMLAVYACIHKWLSITSPWLIVLLDSLLFLILYLPLLRWLAGGVWETVARVFLAVGRGGSPNGGL